MIERNDVTSVHQADCLLCATLNSASRADFLIFTPHVVALVPPWSRGVPSVAVIPRAHQPSFEHMLHDEFRLTFDAAIEVMSGLRQAYDPDGMNFWWDEGAAAGQVLPHTFIEVACRFRNTNYKYRPLNELPPHGTADRRLARDRVARAIGASVA